MTEPRDPTLDVLLDLDGQGYRDAATLLADFWELVDAVLRERGVIS
ncbi:MAG TPA: hypothetical protein VFA50_20745 [Stellaceae bacterium]|nr:hypothetical protein [Stellaceae bacterium]